MSGEAKALHLDSIGKQLEGMVATHKLVGAEARDVYRLSSQFTRAASAHGVAAVHTEAAGKGLRMMMKNMAHIGGRLSVLQAVLAVGAVAATGAAFTIAGHENKKGKDAVANMKADLGADSAIVKQAEALQKKQTGARLVSAGISSVAQSANVPIASVHGGMGMMQMLGLQAGLPMVGDVIVPKNELLKAYNELEQDDKGEAKMEPAERIQKVRLLVAEVPEIKQKGGFYNPFTEPMAAEIVKRKLNVHDTMKLLGDKDALIALGEQVKPQTAKHAAAPAEKKPAHPQPAMMAAAPAKLVSAERSLEGRVTQPLGLQHA
jgi:hypothetical protein